MNPTASAGHVPVMLREVVEALRPSRGAILVDGTFGAGGYSAGLLAALLTVNDWVTPTPGDWLWFLLAGCCGGGIHFGIVAAYRYAPAGAVAPLEYTNLIWAALAAYLVFGEMPNASAAAGGCSRSSSR